MKHSEQKYDHTFIFSKEELSLSLDELNKLEELVDAAIFEKPERGDTKEELSVGIMRAKKPTDPNIYNEPLLDIIQKKAMSDFLKNKLRMKDYFIDRVQIHKYEIGDFIAMHCDAESCSDYKYTIILHMNDDYEGGNFRVKVSDDNILSFKLDKFSLIATDCRLPHEVIKVTKGVRKIIVWFVSEKDLTKDTLSITHKVA